MGAAHHAQTICPGPGHQRWSGHSAQTTPLACCACAVSHVDRDLPLSPQTEEGRKKTRTKAKPYLWRKDHLDSSFLVEVVAENGVMQSGGSGLVEQWGHIISITKGDQVGRVGVDISYMLQSIW